MEFSPAGGRRVLAAFDGGEMTSDAGILLLREGAWQNDLFDRMAACCTGPRHDLAPPERRPS